MLGRCPGRWHILATGTVSPYHRTILSFPENITILQGSFNRIFANLAGRNRSVHPGSRILLAGSVCCAYGFRTEEPVHPSP